MISLSGRFVLGYKVLLPRYSYIVILCALLTCASVCFSATSQAAESPAASSIQSVPAQRLTLPGAVDLALRNYPRVREYNERVAEAGSEVSLARTAYLPRLQVLYEEWRATTNNSVSLAFPNMPIPNVTGPAHVSSSFRNFWGANAGAWCSWDLVDFGQRRSQVNIAKAAKNESTSALATARLDVAANAADAFLTLVAAEQVLEADQANFERMKVFATAVHALVKATLRPGVEASRADAEVALAQNRVIEEQQNVDVARAMLAETLGIAGSYVECDPGDLLKDAPSSLTGLAPVEQHPAALQRAAAVRTTLARQEYWRRSWLPHFTLQSAIFGKGSTNPDNGRFADTGFLPRVPNWSVGLTCIFPVSNVIEANIQRKIQVHAQLAEQARYDKTIQTLRGQVARSDAVLKAALALKENAPKFLKAAQDTEVSATTRYRVGLDNVVDVANAERLLTQAQVTDRLAYIGVWRALFAHSVAHGDVSPMLRSLASANSSGGYK